MMATRAHPSIPILNQERSRIAIRFLKRASFLLASSITLRGMCGRPNYSFEHSKTNRKPSTPPPGVTSMRSSCLGHPRRLSVT